MIQSPDLQERQPFGAGPDAGEAIEINPDVLWFRILSPGAPMGGVNVWALRDGQGWALVDTGFADPGSWEQWEAIIARLDGPVTRLICTHFHPDHIGQVGNLLARFAVPLMMTGPEWDRAQRLAGPRDPVAMAIHVEHLRRCGLPAELLGQMAATGGMQLTTGLPETCEILQAGDRLELGDGHWEVSIGKGHSPAPALFDNQSGKLIIVGDQLLMRITPHIGVDADDPEADPLGDYFAFLERAEGMDEDVLALPGHGPAFTHAGTRAREIAAHHEERLTVLVGALDRPKLPVETIEILFGRQLKGIGLLLGLSEAHAHLRHLAKQGRAVCELDECGRYRFRACGAAPSS